MKGIFRIMKNRSKFRVIRFVCTVVCAALLCISFASCSVQKAYAGAPEGMRPINDGAIGATLYVPSSWCVDTSLDIPMGYVSSKDRTMVTLVYISADEVGEASVPEYWLSYKERFVASMKDFELIKDSEDAKDYTTRLIAGKDAYEFEFTANVTELAYHFRQALLRADDGGIYIITYSAFEDNYETHLDVLLEDIYGNFAFTNEIIPVEDDNTLKPGIDEEVSVPEGMQLISNNAVDYLMFVPENWKISVNTGISAAYASETDKASVSTVAFNTDNADIDSFWASYEADITSTLGAPVYIDEANKFEECKLDGYDARTYAFLLTSGDVQYRYSETVLIRNGYVYIITCCAEASAFEAHSSEFARVLSEFRFK